MTPALELIGAAVRLGRRQVLTGVDLAVAPGEVVGVAGANGSGKTTLLRAALGLAALSAGEARLGGRPIARLGEVARAALAGYLPQERRVGWNMAAWRIAALGAVTCPPAEAHRRASSALAQVEMAALASRGVRDMSGGERARVLLARLLATGAPLLIADEPAAGLDPDAQFMVMELLRRRADAGAAILATFHDLTLAARACDRLAVVADGRLAALGSPAEVLTPHVLAGAFGLEGALISSPAGPVVAAKRTSSPGPFRDHPPHEG